MFFETASNMTSITATYCKAITSTTLAIIAKRNPHLQRLNISGASLLTDKLEKVCKEQKPPMTVGGHVHAILKEKIEAKANADATADSLMGAAISSTVPAARKSFRSELDIHKVANSQHIHLRRSCELPIFLGGFRSTAPKFQRANLLSPCMLTFAPTFMTESYPAGIVAREL